MVPKFALDFLEIAARGEPGGSPDPSLSDGNSTFPGASGRNGLGRKLK